MLIRYSSHDELFEPHICPSCSSYWSFCTTCGVVETPMTEAIVHSQLFGKKFTIYFGSCKICREPMYIHDNDKVHYELCPSCEKWESKGPYWERVEELHES